MRRLVVWAVAAGIAMAAAPVALARDLPGEGLTRDEIVKWLENSGRKAKLDFDKVANDTTVSASTKDVNWAIYFYNCDKDHCKSIQYAAAWDGKKISAATINNWNSNRRFLRAYKNGSGLVFAEFDADLNGGTWEQLDQSLTRWDAQVGVFDAFVKTGKLPK